MNHVTLHDGRLVVEPRGLDRLWALRRRIDIPLAHVAGATYDPGAEQEPKGLRTPGLRLGRRATGTFVRDGERTFWNVRGAGHTVVVELRQERFARLVLEVADPRDLVRRINSALV